MGKIHNIHYVKAFWVFLGIIVAGNLILLAALAKHLFSATPLPSGDWLIGVFAAEILGALIFAWKYYFTEKKDIDPDEEMIEDLEKDTGLVEADEPTEVSIEPPDYYDFEVLKQSVISRYGSSVGVLVVQYGSSVTKGSFQDEDYVALIFGEYFSESTTREQSGSKKGKRSPISLGYDLQEIISDSFVSGLIIGRPFEISVAIHGVVVDSMNASRKYWDWYQALAHNITVDSDYLIKQTLEDIRETKVDFHRSFKDKDIYRMVIAAYHICCDLLKIEHLRTDGINKYIGPELYPLSQASILANSIESDEEKAFVAEVIECFKTGREPLKLHTFLHQFEMFVKQREESIYERV